MKEIVAVIRVNMIQTTKEALAKAGFPSLTANRVMGRGKQKGLHFELHPPLAVKPKDAGKEKPNVIPVFHPSLAVKEDGGKEEPKVIPFIPKRMISMLCQTMRQKRSRKS